MILCDKENEAALLLVFQADRKYHTAPAKSCHSERLPDVLFNKVSFSPSETRRRLLSSKERVSSVTNYGYLEVSEAY